MASSAQGKVQAFVLVEAKAGEVLNAGQQIAKIEGVIASYAVTGPFDVIVHVEADDIRSLGQLVVAKIQALSNVSRTLTCVVVESSEDG
jgi:DNA-binding Lrp family transcriptional regulator